jgi:hypothetical protein
VHSAGVQDRDGAALVLERITRRFPFLEKFFADAGNQGHASPKPPPRPVGIIKRTDTGFVVQFKRQGDRAHPPSGLHQPTPRPRRRTPRRNPQGALQLAMIKLMARRIAR